MNSFASLDRQRRHSTHTSSVGGTRAQRLLPAAGLFVAAPLVAEFLLGNISITHLGLLGILAPLYGGGALLIREFVRRTGRGWPSIFVLALAYGILEEAFLMQSLFNPNFLGKHLHLLDPAYLPAFGTGAWYVFFVLTLHTVWSISVPIALIESVVPQRADSAWLDRLDLAVVAFAFALACFAVASSTKRMDPVYFGASAAQFAWSAAIILVLVAAGFFLSRRITRVTAGPVPNPWTLAIGSLILASAFLAVPSAWGWWAVLAYVAFDAVTILLVAKWSEGAAWRAIHKLGLAGGATVAYAIHAFVETPSVGHSGAITRIGNLVFALGAATLIGAGVRKAEIYNRRSLAPSGIADRGTL